MELQARKVLCTGVLTVPRSGVLKLIRRKGGENPAGVGRAVCYRTRPRPAKSPNKVVHSPPTQC